MISALTCAANNDMAPLKECGDVVAVASYKHHTPDGVISRTRARRFGCSTDTQLQELLIGESAPSACSASKIKEMRRNRMSEFNLPSNN